MKQSEIENKNTESFSDDITPQIDESLTVEKAYEQGRNYEYGWEDVQQNYLQAYQYYQYAADRGDIRAQYSLGGMFEYGRGTAIQIDYAKAFNYYKLAAEGGHRGAKFELALQYKVQKNYPEAVKLLEELILRYEDPGAKINLALMCQTGEDIPQDLDKARVLYEEVSQEDPREGGIGTSARRHLKELEQLQNAPIANNASQNNNSNGLEALNSTSNNNADLESWDSDSDNNIDSGSLNSTSNNDSPPGWLGAPQRFFLIAPGGGIDITTSNIHEAPKSPKYGGG